MSVGRISAFISLPVSAECGRMTQPYMIDAFSSNGLAHCPSYRLSAVRPELKKRRDLPADCTIPKKNSVTWLKQSEWKYKKHKYSTWAEVLKQGDPKSECSPWARLSCHPELGLLIMSLSLALVYHPSASHYWLNGLDRSGGGSGDFCSVERLCTIMRRSQGLNIIRFFLIIFFISSALQHMIV